MTFTQPFPSDPNVSKKRVPEMAELKTLHNIAQRNERMMQDLDKQIEEGERTYLALQHRYEELLRSIEGFKSDIVATKRSVDMLKSQKSLISDDQQKLAALLHPIRPTPSDVLQYIFEWTIEVADSRFHCATVLSHVCHRWREVALQTSKLWTEIHVSLEAKHECVRSFWTRTVERVKAVATSVTISVAGTTEAHQKVLRQCRLDLLQNVDKLEFRLQTAEAATFLASSPIYRPTGPINELVLDGTGVPDLTVNIVAITRRFPTTSLLEIRSVSKVAFNQGVNISTVTRVILDEVASISLHSLAQAFPDVEFATISHTTFRVSTTAVPFWPKLKELLISTPCENMQWEHLAARNLTRLLFSGDVTEAVMTFIASQKSLRYLDISYSPDHVYSIAKSAPQLVKLATDPCEEIADRKGMRLNKLTHLIIYEAEETPLSLELFEKIVRGRFLPKNTGRKSSATAESIWLKIMVPTELQPCREWQESELILSAHQEVHTTGRNYMAYCFRWK